MNTYPVERLREFATRVFVSCEVPKEDASTAADVLVTADVWGIDSHGVARLSAYFEMLKRGLINPRPQIKTVRDHPATAVVDADNGLGLVVGPRANEIAIEKADPRFAELLNQMYEELEGAMPGFRTFKRKLGLLISSPSARVFYHFDVPGQALWQVRGRKRIWIYPPTKPFLPATEVENVVRSLAMEDLSYEPWYDEYAEVYDMEPGDMLHWALNGPHRVSNLDSVCVSLTTEHWTPEIRRSYAMHYGNGILRNVANWSPRSSSLDGPAFWAKAGLTAAWRKSGMQKKQGYKRVLSYKVDPDAPLGVVPLDDKDRLTVNL